MEWLFGHRMTPDEMLRKNQRALNKAMRDLDRERLKMEQQEKKVIADIKKLAKEGQMDAVKIMAKDLVRTRRYVRKFMLMKANIQAVSLKIQTLKSQSTMAQAMRGVTRAMATMNRQLNMPQIQKILQEFEKQSEIMDMKEEMMNDSIDEAMEGDDDEEESDAVVSQIFDELGLQLNDQLSGLPQATGSLSVPGEWLAPARGRRRGRGAAECSGRPLQRARRRWRWRAGRAARARRPPPTPTPSCRRASTTCAASSGSSVFVVKFM
ncbi:charged multivesicular body protein 2a isoform X1 [Hyposmocoma kahamanoa]|uniref:charged multivesicular body protein 2a isoform X1 n=1 Tax=Hyposmocoma kahamanoa TaxID=1477025 RepID=UPI000E6D6971|nr:charged multivesicular body protein 2a isoform X1 [Hyposmocoma kahamanoa]